MRSVVLSSILLLIGALAFSSTAPAQGTGQFGTVTQGETKTYTNPSPGIPNPTTLDFYVIYGEVQVSVMFCGDGPPHRTTDKRYKAGEGFSITAPPGYVICELEVKGVAPVSVFGFSASP